MRFLVHTAYPGSLDLRLMSWRVVEDVEDVEGLRKCF